MGINDQPDDPMENENEQDDENVNKEDYENVNKEDNQNVNEEDDGNDMNTDENNVESKEHHGVPDFYDRGNWGKVESGLRIIMVEKGPAARQPIDFTFPREKVSGRHFSHSYYRRILSNGEKQDRRWLVYSKTLDKIFCFCCKLFTRDKNPSHMASKGLSDWKNILERLKKHETSHEHIKCMSQWMDFESRLKKNQTINKHVQQELRKERNYWMYVMLRIFLLVKTLAKQNLAFRGSNEKLKADGNENFLSFIDIMAEWNPVMREHVRRYEDRESRYYFLSNKIQNELIKKIADEIKAKVEEYFLTFLKVDDTSGEGLFCEIQNVLVALGLNIDDVRGQGYYNGYNMKGKHKGVQKRFLDVNPRAFYTLCGSHSLNLALCDTATTS
ncbi:unnamed protein product [Arabidopsis thaliana]|uniref:TTF-type domain-containing protein n=1 Tax=Arabidopsis thaliana TaxID=3702 RepID=A0A654G4U1_ARATH|nr:unnamed protein product [Arabidopsis thaliana]